MHLSFPFTIKYIIYTPAKKKPPYYYMKDLIYNVLLSIKQENLNRMTKIVRRVTIICNSIWPSQLW